MAARAVEQVDDDALRRALHPETNSIAVIMKHLAGNMISRWTNFLTSDGEKPDRDRDAEFVDDFSDRAAVLAYAERGWNCLFAAIEGLTDADLERTVTIRGEPHTVIQAIARQVDHYAYHVGQIVLIARIHAGAAWQTLTIPRGGSRTYNKAVWGKDSYRTASDCEG